MRASFSLLYRCEPSVFKADCRICLLFAAVADTNFTTPYEYLGVAQYALGDLEKATRTFEEAVRVNDRDVESWLQLGKCYLYALKMPQAAAALEKAVFEKGATKETHTLFKVRIWMADWHDREPMLEQIQEFIDANLNALTSVSALDFAEFSPSIILALSRQAAAHSSSGGNQALCCDKSDLHLKTPALRVGFVSSDFGVHPVSTLMRGMLEMLSSASHSATVVYCFSLTAESSWCRRNISRSVDHMVSLVGKNPPEGAAIIKQHGIHVLIDLNGHTLHSGLAMFDYRPSPVQMSFLGYPMTTGSTNIDFFISDAVSTPAEYSAEVFTEKLLFLPTHYIVNDHMQMLGHTIEGERPLLPQAQGDASLFVFATFSNWQKIDPSIFSAWMAILARVPHSVLWFLRYPGHEDAEKNLKREANGHGIDGEKRLVFSDLAPWIHHTHSKRAADLILDTSMKNGHTTMIDALMAGVPVVTLESNRMSNRAGSSALHSLDLHDLTVNSFKEYVEVAVLLATNSHLLGKLRANVEKNRLQYPLFDTRKYTANFESALQSSWTVMKASCLRDNKTSSFHVFSASRLSQIVPREFPVLSGQSDTHVEDEYIVKVNDAIADNRNILLHIGGHATKREWWIVDANDRADVDFHVRMDNLHPFRDSSVTAIYASHVLEHCHYRLLDEVHATLREWFRVLRPGGALFVSVPDLLVLSTLFANATTTDAERFFIMNIMYGGQVDAFDVHKVGFFAPLLESYLQDAGFCEIERVENFGLFADASTMRYKDVAISLNVKATACKGSDHRVHVDLLFDNQQQQ